MTRISRTSTILLLVYLLPLLSLSCGPSNVPATATSSGETVEAEPPPGTADAADEAYPGVEVAPQIDSPYPGPRPTLEGLQLSPPVRDIPLPEAEGALGVVGGILIREVVGEGFVPLIPQGLYLGEIVPTDSGEPAFVRTTDGSPSAQLLPTGIFTFNNISPGEYGLVVDLGFTQFLVTSPDGEALTFTVEAGKALDLGQVITQIPD